MRRPSLSVLLTCLLCFGLLSATVAAQSTATASEGTVTVIKDGAQSSGSDNLNVPLSPGTIITTGEDGYITIQIAPGITMQLQPNTQVTIGDYVPGKATNEAGDPIPEITVRLAVGSVLVTTTTEGVAGTSFVIETARGIMTSVTAGSMVVSSTGADPATATVTVASPVGSDLVTTTEGEQLPVGEGLVVVLRPDGIEYSTVQDFPDLPGVNVPFSNVPLPPVGAPPPNPPAPSPTPAPVSP